MASAASEQEQEISHTEIAIADKGWVLVQIKAFTAWINQTLQTRSMRVDDLSADLQSGIILINFFELLSGKKFQQKYERRPFNRIHKIQNNHMGLQFVVTEMQVPLVGIGAEDIVDTNLKLVLGLIWTLYRKYRIATIKVH